MLIPGTLDTASESSASLLYEDDSRTVFLVWESRINGIHPVLKLAGFDGSELVDADLGRRQPVRAEDLAPVRDHP